MVFCVTIGLASPQDNRPPWGIVVLNGALHIVLLSLFLRLFRFALWIEFGEDALQVRGLTGVYRIPYKDISGGSRAYGIGMIISVWDRTFMLVGPGEDALVTTREHVRRFLLDQRICEPARSCFFVGHSRFIKRLRKRYLVAVSIIINISFIAAAYYGREWGYVRVGLLVCTLLCSVVTGLLLSLYKRVYPFSRIDCSASGAICWVDATTSRPIDLSSVEHGRCVLSGRGVILLFSKGRSTILWGFKGEEGHDFLRVVRREVFGAVSLSCANVTTENEDQPNDSTTTG